MEMENSFKISTTTFSVDLEKLIALMPGSIYWKNRDGLILGVNEIQAHNAGFSSTQEVVGKTSYDLIWRDLPEPEKHRQAELEEEIDKSVMLSGTPSLTEEVITTAKGPIYCLRNRIPLKNNLDEIIGLINISMEISEPKKTEKALQKKRLILAKALPIQQQMPLEDPHHPAIKILLVEDNEIACRTVKALLESMCHEVDTAGNSVTAITLFKPNKYDLVLTDVGLPDLDGYKLTEQLRKIEKDFQAQPKPIIALTAHDSSNISKKAFASGINAILNKPLSAEALLKILDQFVYQQQADAEDGQTTTKTAASNSRVRPMRKVIDLDEGAKILGKSRDIARIMLDDFIKSLSEARAEIEQAFCSNDLEKLLDTIHKFHGGLCYVGVPYLRQAAKELETILIKQEKHQINRFYQRLLNEMSAVDKEYQTFFTNHESTE